MQIHLTKIWIRMWLEFVFQKQKAHMIHRVDFLIVLVPSQLTRCLIKWAMTNICHYRYSENTQPLSELKVLQRMAGYCLKGNWTYNRSTIGLRIWCVPTTTTPLFFFLTKIRCRELTLLSLNHLLHWTKLDQTHFCLKAFMLQEIKSFISS